MSETESLVVSQKASLPSSHWGGRVTTCDCNDSNETKRFVPYAPNIRGKLPGDLTIYKEPLRTSEFSEEIRRQAPGDQRKATATATATAHF